MTTNNTSKQTYAKKKVSTKSTFFDNSAVDFTYEGCIEEIENGSKFFNPSLEICVWTRVDGNHITKSVIYGVSFEKISELIEKLAVFADEVKKYEDAVNTILTT